MTFGRVFVSERHNNAPKRVAAAAVALLVTGAAPAGARQEAAPCDRFVGGATAVGTVGDPSLVEISGVAASRVHAGVLWAHNDSGGQPSVTALSDTGDDLGTYAVPGATATDWEDIAAGPGPDLEQSYLYVGDIGDNAAARPFVEVHRVPEPLEAPDGADGRFAEDVVLRLRYPGGPVDAEALLVDPRTGDLVVVGKRPDDAPVFTAEASEVAEAGDVTLRQVATLDVGPDGAPLGLVTGGDVSPEGSVVLLRTYTSVATFARLDGEPLAAAFESTPCAAPVAAEPQGEALGFLADGSGYVTISEGTAPPINQVVVDPALEPTTTTTTSTPPPTAAEDEDDGDDGVPAGVWVAAAAVVVVVGALAWVLTARRRR
jgi:hypothetical protein